MDWFVNSRFCVRDYTANAPGSLNEPATLYRQTFRGYKQTNSQLLLALCQAVPANQLQCINQVIEVNQSGVKDSVNSSAADIGDPSLTRLIRNYGTPRERTGKWRVDNGGVTWTRCIDDD